MMYINKWFEVNQMWETITRNVIDENEIVTLYNNIMNLKDDELKVYLFNGVFDTLDGRIHFQGFPMDIDEDTFENLEYFQVQYDLEDGTSVIYDGEEICRF